MAHYVIVRSDMPIGDQIAQTAHAAGESAGGPLPDETIVVALSVPSEDELRRVADRLSRAQIGHRLIVENEDDLAGQATAIGVVPTRDRRSIRRVLSRLPLAG